MAVYLFSALANDTVVEFDPAQDELRFDDPQIGANQVLAFVYNGDLWVRVVNGPSEGRSVFLRGISPFEVTRHNITFADGSLLLYGDDALATGDDAPNSLVGGDGGDHLEGFGGDDTLSGGLGDDRMDGGPGISLLIGGAGNDTLDADSSGSSTGNSRLYGGVGDDHMNGRGGNDLLVGGPGNDNAFGGAGRDRLHGGGGDDWLGGSMDNDHLYGAAGDDTLQGDPGNDTLEGGAGGDRLEGGDGDDLYYVDSWDDYIFEQGGTNDRVVFSVDGYIVGAGIESATGLNGAAAAPYFVSALAQPGIHWGQYGQPVTLTYGFLTQNTAYNTSGNFYALTDEQKQMVRDALADWAAKCGITFVEQDDALGADIRFGSNDNGGGYAYYPPVGEVWIGHSAYSDYVVLHEIGHALGLKHAGNYGGAPGPYLPLAEDNEDHTVMSYYYGTHAVTDIGPFDIAAIQYLYGPNPAARTGNDTYRLDQAEHIVWDGGGIDRLSAGQLDAAVHIDLNDGHWSWSGAKSASLLDPGQYFISYWTRIENAVGGERRDALTGNELDNRLRGEAGADTLAGGTGHDTLVGGAGADAYLFADAPQAAGADDIVGFATGKDRVLLEHAAYAALGATGAFAAGDGRFHLGAEAADADDRILYDPASGALYYDADGSGAAGAQLIATLEGAPAIAATDIWVT